MTSLEANRKRIAALVLVVAMGFGFFTSFSVPTASAQISLPDNMETMSERELRTTLIMLIMQLLMQLQEQSAGMDHNEKKDTYNSYTKDTDDNDYNKDKDLNSRGYADTRAVKCSIQSNKRVVTLGEKFLIEWYTDLKNPALIDAAGERGVRNQDTKEYVADKLGSQRFAIGSSKNGIACSVDLTVVAPDAEDDSDMVTLNDGDQVCPYVWTRDLDLGDEGEDVKALQKYLNTNADTVVATSGTGSPGNETSIFDSRTQSALNMFQVKYRSVILSPLGLVNPTGVHDASSRAKMNSLCL